MTGSISAPRVGWLVDGFEGTPLAVAMLLESSHGVELRIPTRGPIPSEENPYALWSLSSIVFHHDASWEMYSKRPNTIMQFCSVEGVIVLVGCQVVSSTNKPGLGEIVVRADFAIHGARHLNYEKVNGIQTAIPSLSDWTQLKSAKYYPTTNEIGELQELQVSLQSHKPIVLRRNQGVEIHGHFGVDPQGRSALINESVVLETYYDEPVSWQEQLRVHSIVLEFLSLAAWRPCGISRMRVATALGEQPSSANGEGSRWLEVATQELPLEDAKVERHRFIYPFRDSGPEALDRWLEMHDSYTEVIHPLLSLINSGYHWDNEAAVQSSISLEALAFNISGLPKRERRGVRYRKALDFITDSLGEMPFTDVEQWKSDAVKIYNGAKHPNHAMSDDGLRVETIRRNVAVVRFWFGLQMGYSPAVLNSGFDLDPLLKPGFR